MSDSEQYGPAWIRATVMVHPCGDIHFIGGDRAPGDGDTEYLASKYLRHASKLEESAPTASTNNRYATALDVLNEFEKAEPYSGVTSDLWSWLHKRLNDKSTSQQLKAEIAALIPKLEAIDSITGWQETGPIIRRLRQLSAV